MSLEALEEELARFVKEVEKQKKERMAVIPQAIPLRTILTPDEIQNETSRMRPK